MMEPLEIKKYPDKILRKTCKPVERITERESKLFEEMLFTMRHFCGIGLAAPQIGILQNLIVADSKEKTVKLANPEIVKIKGVDKMTEGCLSISNVGVEIERSYEVIVKGLNEKGEIVEVEAKGLLARVLQHEIDHLEGKLIIDYMSILKKLQFGLGFRNGRVISAHV